MILILRRFRGGPVEGFMGGGQSSDIFRGGPVKKNTLYNIGRRPPNWERIAIVNILESRDGERFHSFKSSISNIVDTSLKDNL